MNQTGPPLQAKGIPRLNAPVQKWLGSVEASQEFYTGNVVGTIAAAMCLTADRISLAPTIMLPYRTRTHPPCG